MRRSRAQGLALRAAVAMAAVGAALAAAGEVAAEPFTLEEVLSAPLLGPPVAAAAAERIAWTENLVGAHSLWTAAAPTFDPRRLVRYPHDDGQSLGGLELTPDGSLLVYVLGGGPNAAGETPNPASDPDGVEQAIWAVATAGGEPWRIASGGGPVVAPDGASLAFARGDRVFEAELAPPGGGEEAEPRELFTARGGLSSLAWSPAGGRLAFVSNRGDHSFVGVFDRARRRITWVAPSVDRDSNPVWSPDGSRLAFLRSPGRRMGELFDLTAGVPFEVWVGDPVSGEAARVWRSPGADGGFAQYYPARPLAWPTHERLVFASEHEGWLHYYSLAPAAVDAPTAAGGQSAGEPVDLTPGEAEAEWIAFGEAGRVVFSGNFADRHRRHLYRTTVDGGEPAALTRGEVIDTDPVLPASGRYLAFRRSTARRPGAISVLELAGGETRRLAPARWPRSFPARRLVEPSAVRFVAADGVEVHGQLFLPQEKGKRPAVIYLHGGPTRQMLVGFHYSGYYARAYAFNQYLASRGYVVLAVNFRSGIGYGRAFRQAEDQGPRGASEYQDVVAAARYLASREEVDAQRIGLWGGSYGGYLTALGLARDSDLFAAGVDLHGVHDWAWRGEHFRIPGGVWGLSGDFLLEQARRSSPVWSVDRWRSPVLFVHGDDDRNVDFVQTTDLVQRLRERGVPVELLVLPDEVHGFLRHASWLATFRAAADFFDRTLAGTPPEG